jgi:hypothetical protein
MKKAAPDNVKQFNLFACSEFFGVALQEAAVSKILLVTFLQQQQRQRPKCADLSFFLLQIRV